MKRAEVYKLGPTWLIAQEDGKFWCVDIRNGWQSHYKRFPTHAEALAHALREVGLTPCEPKPPRARCGGSLICPQCARDVARHRGEDPTR